MSKDKKTVFKWFTIFQYEKEQEYLGKMHAKGWKLKRVSGLGFYHFVKCEPEEMVYQLDYNQGGTDNQEEYLQMFKDCGWEYLFDHAGYSYFRKSMSNMQGKEEIFCDDESRLDMMKRVIQGRVITLIPLFCCIVLPNFVRTFNDNDIFRKAGIGFSIFFGLSFVLYVWIFVYSLVWYLKFKNKLGK